MHLVFSHCGFKSHNVTGESVWRHNRSGTFLILSLIFSTHRTFCSWRFIFSPSLSLSICFSLVLFKFTGGETCSVSGIWIKIDLKICYIQQSMSFLFLFVYSLCIEAVSHTHKLASVCTAYTCMHKLRSRRKCCHGNRQTRAARASVASRCNIKSVPPTPKNVLFVTLKF